MADIRIEREREVESGWEFDVRVNAGQAADPARFALTLSWADYDHWSSGTEPPSEIARQVVEFVLAHRPADELPRRFDAATVRRWWPEIDGELTRGR